MRSVAYQRKVGDSFFPEVLAVIIEKPRPSYYQSDDILLVILRRVSEISGSAEARCVYYETYKNGFQIFYSRFGIIPNSMERVFQKLMVT
jgi:hypothetical protein